MREILTNENYTFKSIYPMELAKASICSLIKDISYLVLSRFSAHIPTNYRAMFY